MVSFVSATPSIGRLVPGRRRSMPFSATSKSAAIAAPHVWSASTSKGARCSRTSTASSASSSSWTRGHGNKVPGDALTDNALVEAARLIRELHDAAADFRPPIPSGVSTPIRCFRPRSYVTAISARTTRSTGRSAAAFIDWDGARPNEPLLEFGMAAWWHVPLMDDAYCAEMGFAEPPDRGRRLRLFADAYGAAGKTCSTPSARPSSERRSGPATGPG